MDAIRQYILSVICMAIVCGIVQMLFPSGTVASVVKILSGLIVTIAVLSPLLQEKVLQWDLTFESIVSDGEAAVAEGQTAAEDALAQLIKEETQTYILNKASALGADITVEVQLRSEYPNEPASVTVRGAVSPYVKQQLANCLSQELGIAEEDQIWIS